MRIKNHPILGPIEEKEEVTITVDGTPVKAFKGETIASALIASGIKVFRKTRVRKEPRGVFCAIGRCTDCIMTVNGKPNVRTCVTPVHDGMIIYTQK